MRYGTAGAGGGGAAAPHRRGMSAAPAPPPHGARASVPAYARPAPYPAPGLREPRVPKGTGEMRRFLAVGLDCYLCLLVVGLLVRSCVDSGVTGRAVALLVVQLAVLSFANQVLLTMAVRASAGKLIMGVRVIRLPDAGRPGFRPLVLRWLYGLLWLPSQPWRRLRTPAAGPGPECPGARPADPHRDLAGVRQVRRSDLRSYRAAVRGRPH